MFNTLRHAARQISPHGQGLRSTTVVSQLIRRSYAAKASSAKAGAQAFKKKNKVHEAKPKLDSAVQSNVLESVRPSVDLRAFLPEMLSPECVNEVMAIPTSVTDRMERISDLPKDLNKDLVTTYNDALMVRKSSLALLQLTEAAGKTDDAKLRVVLTGKSGVGKSAILLQTVSYCLSANWLVVYVPNAIAWVDGRYPYAPVADSTPNAYDQSTLAQKALAAFKRLNAATLANVEVNVARQFGEHKVAKDAPLTQLIDIGLNVATRATDVWCAVIDELQQLETMPVLFAVDELNAFYTASDYHHADSTPVMPEHLRLVKPLMALFDDSASVIRRGLAIGATSLRDARFGVNYPAARQEKPACIHMAIPSLDNTETLRLMDYYYRAQVSFEEPNMARAIATRTLTNGNPRQILKSCTMLV